MNPSPSHVDPDFDWLVSTRPRPAELVASAESPSIILQNGLLRRTFRTAPNAAGVSLDNLSTGQSMLRSVRPEAVLELNGKRYEIGGLKGQPEHAYLLPEWLDEMTSDPDAFQFTGYRKTPVVERLPWKRVRHSDELPWPPPGVGVALEFVAPESAEMDGVTVEIRYELYDGMPVLCKWFVLRNDSNAPVRLNRFESEILAVVEPDNTLEEPLKPCRPRIHLQSDYAFCGGSVEASNQTAEWTTDPEFTSQVSYELKSPCLLKSRPLIGPDQILQPGDTFESYRTFALLHDGDDRERQGLAVRRMMRAMAPWCTENPIMLHLRASDSEHIRQAVDQCAEVGFETIVISFWSGLEMTSQDPSYLARIKADVDYAHSKGIEIGGYTLTASSDAGPGANVVCEDVPNPKTGNRGAVFGQSPCLASSWSDDYYARLDRFVEETGFDLVEDDGSYPGDVCASSEHLHHRGLDDSQWVQWKTITAFYRRLRGRGVYINVPDFYYLAGANKCGMGYRETNWSLPRDRQIVLGRQNLFDGTWEKTPSMGWMFVPLAEYHGGGAEATLEPLEEHLDAYEAHLAQNFGFGVQACYRGPRLYDTDKTRGVIKKWVDFYKAHRDILNSDLIHVRRADGVGVDGVLHVNPRLKERGLAMLFNPRDEEQAFDLRMPLYYTGLTDTAVVREQGGPARTMTLDRAYSVRLHGRIPGRAVTWFTFGE